GRKTMARQIMAGIDFPVNMVMGRALPDKDGKIYAVANGENIIVKLRYKVGEVVAVAQSYRDIFKGMGQDDGRRAKYADEKYTPGYGNKMYVRADMMIEHIRIKGVRCERLQDISDEDCMKEGVVAVADFKTRDCSRKLFALQGYEYAQIFNTPRRAFASLIDRVSGRGTWDRNPWVVVYEFELVK
ncbi:hypothetical protein, partial [uncultured Alistipes sp.]|uniref:hypothetical protein n=1 Tax=uncultured Alistipes sp. TaxID=538949 RepID=UPI002593ACD3